MPVKKKQPFGPLLTILSVILLILFVLKFDVVTSAIDPTGKMGLAAFASNAFPLVLGALLIVLGIAAASTVWVAIGLIVVGVGMIATASYSIWKRNQPTTTLAGE